MRYVYDNDLHIHSQISLCSADEKQTTMRILEYAKQNGLKTICLTDHFWDEKVPGASDWYQQQDFAHISSARPLPQTAGIRFLFGCETEMDQFMTVGLFKERLDEFDFIVIPTTHLHMRGFTISPDERSVEAKVKHWVKRLDALLEKDLPFHKIGIAHLATICIMPPPREDYIKALDAIDEGEMVRLFTKAAKLGCGIELNASDMDFKDEEADSVLRMFRIAKKCGCKFYMGSDAHHPDDLDKAKALFERAIDLLELTEEDKFHIGQ